MAAMGYPYHANRDCAFGYLADNAMIGDPTPPKPRQIPFQGLSKLSRIVSQRNALDQIIADLPLNGFIELAKFPGSRFIPFNFPGQVPAPIRSC